MGEALPASVDGKPATFEYMKSKDGSKQLAYTLTEHNKTITIDGDSIVGVSSPIQQGRRPTLVYVESRQNPPDVGQDQGIPTLDFVNAEGLPDDFVRDFAVQDYAATRSHNDVGNSSPNIHVVISTLSGTGLARDFFHHAVHPVLTRLMALLEHHDYAVHTTESASSVTSRRRRARSGLGECPAGRGEGASLLRGW